MSKYSAYFLVENHTDGTITNVSAQHHAALHGTKTITLKDLEKGQESSKKHFWTGGSSLDHWDVSFVNEHGKLTTGTCTCAVHDDKDAGKTIKIHLHETDWSIYIPSGDCKDKDYTQSVAPESECSCGKG